MAEQKAKASATYDQRASQAQSTVQQAKDNAAAKYDQAKASAAQTYDSAKHTAAVKVDEAKQAAHDAEQKAKSTASSWWSWGSAKTDETKSDAAHKVEQGADGLHGVNRKEGMGEYKWCVCMGGNSGYILSLQR